jgi:hypothetical protein
MPITSYAELQQDVFDHLDGGVDFSRMPGCIALAEAALRRMLVMPEQITVLPMMVGSSTPMPADLSRINSLSITGARPITLQQTSAAHLADLDTTITGLPSLYAVQGSTLLTWPGADQAYSANLVYERTLPSLSDAAPSNWLLAEHPDVYLYGAMAAAEFFGWNDTRLPLVKSIFEGTVDQVNQAGQRKRYGGGPIVMRPAVNEYTRGIYR